MTMGSMLPPVRGLHEPPEPDPDDIPAGGPPDNDQDDSGGVSPDWVSYHDDQTVCGACQHLQGEQCEVLKMPVPQGGHCEAWEPQEQQTGQVPGPEAAGGPPSGSQPQ